MAILFHAISAIRASKKQRDTHLFLQTGSTFPIAQLHNCLIHSSSVINSHYEFFDPRTPSNVKIVSPASMNHCATFIISPDDNFAIIAGHRLLLYSPSFWVEQIYFHRGWTWDNGQEPKSLFETRPTDVRVVRYGELLRVETSPAVWCLVYFQHCGHTWPPFSNNATLNP